MGNSETFNNRYNDFLAIDKFLLEDQFDAEA